MKKDRSSVNIKRALRGYLYVRQMKWLAGECMWVAYETRVQPALPRPSFTWFRSTVPFFVRPLFYYPLLVVSGGFACLRLRGMIIDNWRDVFVYLIEESVEFSIFLKSIFRLNHENMKKARATPAYRILITDCDWLRPIAGKSCDWLPASAGTWPPWPVQVTVTAAVIKLFRINIQAYKWRYVFYNIVFQFPVLLNWITIIV